MAWLKRVLRLNYRFSWRSPYYRSTLTLDHSLALLPQAELVFKGRLARRYMALAVLCQAKVFDSYVH
jgi:hypothetical protein